jgi:hypothetical protein
MTEQTDAAEVLPGTWRNHDDPRDEWPGAEDWNPEHVAGILADAADEYWTALHATYDEGGDTDALGSEYDAMARRIFTGPELAAREAAARAEALREAADALGSGPTMRVLVERESCDWWTDRPVAAWLRDRAASIARTDGAGS